MIWLAIIFSLGIAGVLLFQTLFVGLYNFRLSRRMAIESDEAYHPHTAIILCLRGADPSLTDCLAAIDQQDYPSFELILVVDDLSDPAVRIAQQHYENQGKQPTILNIENRIPTCSLKCSAIITAIETLDTQVEVVALIDADAVVTDQWLSELVAPLADSEVGATTGNRWFKVPESKNIGSLVRCVWNAAAIVQMHLYEIPWGGSLALRRSVIDKTDLLNEWSHGFCEDTMLSGILHREGYRIVRPPELVVVNEESTSLFGALRWIQRQLLTVRLHHPRWPLVWLHGISTGIPFLGFLLSAGSIALNAPTAAFTFLMAALLFELISFFLLVSIHRTNQCLLEESDQAYLKSRELWLYAVALPITQVVHWIATIRVGIAKRISWRKIDYKIQDKKIRMSHYEPYRSPDKDSVNSID